MIWFYLVLFRSVKSFFLLHGYPSSDWFLTTHLPEECPHLSSFKPPEYQGSQGPHWYAQVESVWPAIRHDRRGCHEVGRRRAPLGNALGDLIWSNVVLKSFLFPNCLIMQSTLYVLQIPTIFMMFIKSINASMTMKVTWLEAVVECRTEYNLSSLSLHEISTPWTGNLTILVLTLVFSYR